MGAWCGGHSSIPSRREQGGSLEGARSGGGGSKCSGVGMTNKDGEVDPPTSEGKDSASVRAAGGRVVEAGVTSGVVANTSIEVTAGVCAREGGEEDTGVKATSENGSGVKEGSVDAGVRLLV